MMSFLPCAGSNKLFRVMALIFSRRAQLSLLLEKRDKWRFFFAQGENDIFPVINDKECADGWM